ncbi:TetR/AcrR family transcriptional regulator [Amycolatopsis pithecellobii]|uniref:TetR family transcriptional regulator n=1 Tax=Amycolatopsis pithecellobii TaxID=664692 RepID=A0A6N7Z5M0_9PSEU|nr:TetR family transcriptional regulator [Amycolatopsis pithecellobii]MTD57613.1 TetR family transcriptional regulator [Amycolatopsis pithecellobii]
MSRRPRDADASRTSILAAARLQFGRHGFERTTIRSVAAEAGVDPALVMRYFQNKDGLFAAAARLDVELPDLSEVDPDRIADVLLPVFIGLWGPDGPFLPLLRAATSNPVATEALLGVLTEQVTPALAVLAPDRPAERAALVGAQLLGISVARYVLGVPPIVSMDDATLIEWLRPTLAHYLTGEPGVS